MTVLFISDLHLTPDCPAIARAFCHYLENRALDAEALYILGDFFEYWVGDDAMEPFHQDIAAHLKHYSDSGRELYLMPGNRDFALGKRFLRATGATWLKDPTLVELNGEKILLMHGDSLCTQDQQYLRYRKWIRNPGVLFLLRRTPLSYRKRLGARIRHNSKKAKTGKTLAIMDVTPSEVTRVMEQFSVRTLIHGHTHRPAIHEVSVQNQAGRRYVLGDWAEEKGWEIELTDNGLSLKNFPISRE